MVSTVIGSGFQLLLNLTDHQNNWGELLKDTDSEASLEQHQIRISGSEAQKSAFPASAPVNSDGTRPQMDSREPLTCTSLLTGMSLSF